MGEYAEVVRSKMEQTTKNGDIMSTEKRKYKCEGCGESRPCYVETNQETSTISLSIEDLRCVLDETNQAGYNWAEVTDT